MQISAINSNLYFKANSKYAVNDKENEKRKIPGQEAAVVTGAAGATGSAVAGHSGTFKSFSSVNKKINTTTRNVNTGLQLASETGTKAKSILGKMLENCTKYKQSIINFGQNVSNHKLIKPIMTSKAYKGIATVAGGATAGLVAISGIGEMFSTFARKADQLTH